MLIVVSVNESLGENNIDGSIPEEFNKVATLSALALDSNKLVGTLPDFSALANLSELRHVFCSKHVALCKQVSRDNVGL